MTIVDILNNTIIKLYSQYILDYIKSKSRKQFFCELRYIYAYILYDYGFKNEDIAILLNRNRTSIYHMVRNFRNLLTTDKRFREIYTKIKKQI